MEVKFLLIPLEKARNINRYFLWIGRKLNKFFPALEFDLETAELNISSDKFLTASFFSGLIYGALFSALFFGLFFLKNKGFVFDSLITSLLIGFVFFFAMFVLHTMYPKIIAQKVARDTEAGLIAILRNILIMVSSGISLYKALDNASKSNNGKISEELKEVVKNINSGISEIKALEKLAIKSKSELMKKFSWQLINSLNSGAPVANALKTVLESAINIQKRAIKNYAAELNLWILFYLLLAAALPTLGIIIFVIFSSIGGSSVGMSQLFGIVGFSIIMQIGLIGFVKSRVPKVYL